MASVIAAPGLIKHTSQFATLKCGRVDGRADATLAAFVEAGKAAGIDVALSEDINADRWKKFVFLVALSGATGTTRLPLGPILADRDTRVFFFQLMQEVVAVGRAQGIALPPDFAEERLAFADTTPPGFKASLLHDLERGNRIEIDWLAGKAVELGRAAGVPTPANAAVYAALKLHRMGRG
jgi:2-dehydropantoate 2-reductase